MTVLKTSTKKIQSPLEEYEGPRSSTVEGLSFFGEKQNTLFALKYTPTCTRAPQEDKVGSLQAVPKKEQTAKPDYQRKISTLKQEIIKHSGELKEAILGGDRDEDRPLVASGGTAEDRGHDPEDQAQEVQKERKEKGRESPNRIPRVPQPQAAPASHLPPASSPTEPFRLPATSGPTALLLPQPLLGHTPSPASSHSSRIPGRLRNPSSPSSIRKQLLSPATHLIAKIGRRPRSKNHPLDAREPSRKA
jgi:hypothetical protein